jgi:hypothetical protein
MLDLSVLQVGKKKKKIPSNKGITRVSMSFCGHIILFYFFGYELVLRCNIKALFIGIGRLIKQMQKQCFVESNGTNTKHHILA